MIQGGTVGSPQKGMMATEDPRPSDESSDGKPHDQAIETLGNIDAEQSAADPAIRQKLLHNRFRHVRRDRKSNTDVAAAGSR